MKGKTLRLLFAILALFGVDYGLDSFLKKGLDKGLGLDQHSKVLIVGHSHLMMGLDREMMEKELHCKVTKHTRSGVGMAERYLMTKMYLDSPFSDSLKVVIIGVDPFSFNGSGLSENSYMLFYPWMDQREIGKFIKDATDPATYYAHKVFRTSRYSDDLIKQSIRGWRNDDRNYKTSIFTDSLFEANRGKWDRPILFQKRLVEKFEETIKMCTDRGLYVVLLQTPVLKVLTDSYPKEYAQLLNYYHSLDSSSNHILFLNYNMEYSNNIELFFDPIHLNVTGQKTLTKQLSQDIKLNLQ